MKLILLYRDYCSLCKEMLSELKKYQTQYAFDIEIIDIDSHQIDKVLVTDLGPQETMPEE